jgi:radical SAM superfamily enzyme YgiQ (UPF0313 family)
MEGQMNVLLVYPGTSGILSTRGRDKAIYSAGKQAYSPPLGLVTLAALFPQDWHFQLVDNSFQEITPRHWDENELVVVTGTIFHLDKILEIIREAKRRKKIVAVGGPGVFHFTHEALEAGADYVVKGEGELTVPPLLESLYNGESGVLIEREGPADLTESPVPRFDLLDMTAYVDMSVQFSRGCPFLCEFCDATQLFGRKVRTKTPSQILSELQRLYDLGWRRQIFVVDDNFVGNPARTKELLDEMIPWTTSRGMPFEFYTHSSVNLSKHPDLMDSMVRVGFVSVYLGIETPDKETLTAIKKHQNVKTDLYEACRRINRAGLEIMAGTIIGLDGEKAGSDKRLVEFATANSIPVVEVDLLHALPGTALWNRLKQEGRLLVTEDYVMGRFDDFTINFVPVRPMKEVLDEYFHAMEALYDPSAYLDRAFKHYMGMQPLPYHRPARKPDLREIGLVLRTFARWGILWPTRTKFWSYLARIGWNCDMNRFSRFLRCCITLDHYLEVYKETSAFYYRGGPDECHVRSAP